MKLLILLAAAALLLVFTEATTLVVKDGKCPNGYSPLADESECKSLASKTISQSATDGTISNLQTGSFKSSYCKGSWTPKNTCFVYRTSHVYYTNKDCGQNPAYESHWLVCKSNERNDYLFVANGKCPSDDQTGTVTEVNTIQECRDECNDFHETYFNIVDNGGDKLQCRCYKDCDTHEDKAETKIYEILSATVTNLIVDLDTTIYQQKRELYSTETELDSTKTELDSTKTELEESDKNLVSMTEQRDLWKNRFSDVVKQEEAFATNSFTSQALKKYPSTVEAEVGSASTSNTMTEVGSASTSNTMNGPTNNALYYTLFTMTGIFFGGVGMSLLNSRKDIASEHESLL